MLITEVTVRMTEAHQMKFGNPLAFVSVVFDHVFVVRDMKVIQGSNGHLFVAMPSRLLSDRCEGCGGKNHLRSRYCSSCGKRLDEDRAFRTEDGNLCFNSDSKLHADIAHPIEPRFRQTMQDQILQAFRLEEQRLQNLDRENQQ